MIVQIFTNANDKEKKETIGKNKNKTQKMNSMNYILFEN